jgi:hypothetical protein
MCVYVTCVLECCGSVCCAFQLRSEIATHHVTEHNTPIHNILTTASQLNIFQKALGTLPEDGNVTYRSYHT